MKFHRERTDCSSRLTLDLDLWNPNARPGDGKESVPLVSLATPIMKAATQRKEKKGKYKMHSKIMQKWHGQKCGSPNLHILVVKYSKSSPIKNRSL